MSSKKWTLCPKAQTFKIVDQDGLTIFPETTLEGENYFKEVKNLRLISDAPILLNKLKLILGMYAKGITPSVGMIKEVESLIQKHT